VSGNDSTDRALRRVTVLGAGSWGTTLAVHLSRIGHDTQLWGRDNALVADLQARRANAVYLPDISFPPRLRVTASLDEALADTSMVVAAVPSHGMREILRRASGLVAAGS
jgi:glycerol-3-phosphate dehydrogenase (NAD(P)+)